MNLRNFGQLLTEFYNAPYRRTIAKQQRDLDDVLRMQVCAELFGVPNPVGLYTLELLPFVYEDIHEWHERMGLEDSPLEGFKCC